MAATTPATNRLAHETSPYLLQHSRNPVDWYPWGPEALERAKREQRPILLSIGYAACHWCHVMERESFENEAVAMVMNEHFVCIKVDREERPDLDEIYMAATVAMSGHGGWPMTVFLTPTQEPFYAGTYFPPDDALGRPGLKTLLLRISELWRGDRARLVQQAAELSDHVRGQSQMLRRGSVGEEAIHAAVAQLLEAFDSENGGFGDAPKFPPSASLSLLLRLHRRIPEPTLRDAVTVTLDAMKNGGIYDHLGGGFARYSVDAKWLVPHFEKMLYDNAQLSRVYVEAYQVTGDAEYRRVAAETLDYVAREMQDSRGGYYSATDADSEGVEGKFFVWSPDRIEEVVGQPAAEWFSNYYDVTPEGNWEEVSILNVPRSREAVAADLGVSADELSRSLADTKQKLYAARLRRVPPLTDDKILVSWNGLMISAMAEGARVLAEPRYLASAECAARFILDELSRPDGGLYRTARAGRAHLDAYLEDYAFFADGLLDLYEAGGAESFLMEAVRLAERMIADFGDLDGGAFFQTAHGHEALIARPRDGHDGAVPSANAVGARVLARLGFHLGREDLKEKALAAVSAYARAIERNPRSFATALAVVDLLLEGPIELAFVGKAKDVELDALASEVARHYLPNRVVAHGRVNAAGVVDSELPLISRKALVGGQAALYVCKDFTCQAPAVRASDVALRIADATASLVESRGHVVGQSRLSGSATPDGTRAFSEKRVGLGANGYTRLGATGLTVSRVGFGSYRVDDRVGEHAAALATALERGVNLVDTSTNYADGHSERLIGQVLAEAAQRRGIPREAVVVVSKIGYAQGENLEIAKEREEGGTPFPEVVKLGDGLWHCIHPEWLADQLDRSLERLGLESLDVCLLHNPEYFLSDAEKRRVPPAQAREEYYRRITEAFRHLETEVARGRLRFYGVSSNTAVSPRTDVDATDLARLLSAAKTAGGDAHHFRVAQIPMNLLEVGGALERNAGENGAETALEFANAHGVGVLVNRPLNAIVEGRLVRLADPPEYDAPPFADQLERVKALEAEFATTIAPSLQVPKDGGMKPTDFFRWAEQLGGIAAELDSLEEWREMEAHAIAPRVLETVQALSRVMRGPLVERFRAWQERYLTDMDALFLALRKRGAERSRRRSAAVRRTMAPLLPAALRDAPLSQQALLVLASAPGVTTVLVGMRTPSYVEDVAFAFTRVSDSPWPPAENAVAVLSATRNADLP